MSTSRQESANELNASKSTGPTSIAGKAKSVLNHFSPGFTSSATVAPGEDPEEFKALLDGLTIEHQPATVTEQTLVEQMATNQWLSLRAFRLQGFAFLGAKLGGGDHRAHNELVKTQKQRKKSEIGFESQSPCEAPPAEPENDPKVVSIAPDEFVFSSESIPATRVSVQQAIHLLKRAD